ncbi:DUF4307 domain-containing protein [Arthrobacter sp. H14]|uniref:DUF4307 domain-containing protein n=1 Tax=Arthrobacter sp. H14 TaxID=1312959 RepID=UPI00047D94B0|nr:DUF4307 domain-containing protein [Arthrobacter sp. H14]
MSATQTSSEQSSPSSLANRYGSPKRRLSRRARVIIISAGLLAGVIMMGIFTVLSSTPAVTSKDVGFQVTDSTQAFVEFRVTKDPEATAQCAVQVLNSSFAIVGWKVATIGPTPETEGVNDGRTTAERISVRTESLGVSGGVNSCWIVE